MFGSVVSGRWIKYCDRGRTCYAQPDHYIVGARAVVVFECKLTQCVAGVDQIRQLYRPLLESIYKRPVIGVLVCKWLVKEPDHLILDPRDALSFVTEDIFTWHWLGR